MKKLYITTIVLALSFCGLSVFNMNLLHPLYAKTGMVQKGKEASDETAVTYKKNCASCHDRGIMGAPKPGDLRLQEDIDVLVKNAINGIGNMPARGHASFLSDVEVRSIVEFMASPTSSDQKK